MAAIYDQCVRDSVAAFDTEERGAAYLGNALASLGPAHAFLVIEDGAAVVGYAVSGPSGRDRPTTGRGRRASTSRRGRAGMAGGPRCMPALLARLDAAGAHTQVAVVARPNEASEAVHRALGFELVGVLREVCHSSAGGSIRPGSNGSDLWKWSQAMCLRSPGARR